MFVHLVPNTYVSMVDPTLTLYVFNVDIDANMSASIHVTDIAVSVEFFFSTTEYTDLALAAVIVDDFNAALDLIAEFAANA